MTTPAVSVVIPTRNRRSLLTRGLSTVLSQGVDLEVFVVDEGSDDGTAAYVRGLADPRVHLVRHEVPRGVAAARNAGLERARARWVAFLDDDDFWAPDKLASQIRAADEAGAPWVCAGAVVVDENLRVIGGTRPPSPEALPTLLGYNLVPGGGSGPLVRTDVARSLGGFDVGLSILADWDMWIRLFVHGAPAAVDRPVIGYLRHSRSMSHLNAGFVDELGRMESKHRGTRRELGADFSRSRWLLWTAQMHLRAGEPRQAVRTYVHLAVAHRDAKSVLRAVGGGLFPHVAVRRWQRRAIDQLAPGWGEEAERWLAPLRACGG